MKASRLGGFSFWACQLKVGRPTARAFRLALHLQACLPGRQGSRVQRHGVPVFLPIKNSPPLPLPHPRAPDGGSARAGLELPDEGGSDCRQRD
jgi:hypothetical protein